MTDPLAHAVLDALGRDPEALERLRELTAPTAPTATVPGDNPAVVTVPALLSVATVARLLDCSPRTVRRRIAEGALAAVVDHGRVVIRGDELRAYIDRLERAGGRPGGRLRVRGAPARDFAFLRE